MRTVGLNWCGAPLLSPAPLLAALVGWTGASAAYVLATVLSILAALCLASIPKDNVASPPSSNPLRDLKAGATFVAHHKLLLPILFTAIFFNTAWVILMAVFVVYAVQNLGMSATQVGIALGVDGVGMIVGAMIVPVLARRFSVGTMIVLGPLGGFCGALMLLTLWFPSFWLVCFSFFVFGVGPIVWSITTMTLRQAVILNKTAELVNALFNRNAELCSTILLHCAERRYSLVVELVSPDRRAEMQGHGASLVTQPNSSAAQN